MHLLLKGDAMVFAVDEEGATSETAVCYVPRPPK